MGAGKKLVKGSSLARPADRLLGIIQIFVRAAHCGNKSVPRAVASAVTLGAALATARGTDAEQFYCLIGIGGGGGGINMGISPSPRVSKIPRTIARRAIRRGSARWKR